MNRLISLPLRLSIALALGLSMILLTQIRPAFSQSPVLSVTGMATEAYPGSETTYYLELLNNTNQIVYDGVLSITLPSGLTYIPGSTVALGEGWPLEQREPQINGQTLTWGPYHLPTAGIKVHNPYGIHTLMNDCLVFGDDLSGLLVSLLLQDQPDQVILDSTTRQIYLSFPAAAQVMAVNIDKLTVTGTASLTGGPILDMALDRDRQSLYILSTLAPTYRGLTVLDTPGLNHLALVAGAGEFPMRTAASLALTSTGQLVLAESSGVWQIAPGDFSVRQIYATSGATPATALVIQQKGGAIFALEPFARQLRIY